MWPGFSQVSTCSSARVGGASLSALSLFLPLLQASWDFSRFLIRTPFPSSAFCSTPLQSFLLVFCYFLDTMPRPNQIAGDNRRPPWASATAFCLRLVIRRADAGAPAAVSQLVRRQHNLI